MVAILAVTPASWDPEILKGMFGGASASDLPVAGAQITIMQPGPAHASLVGICYADPASPRSATIDLVRFPIFGTKFPFPTIDATVVS